MKLNSGIIVFALSLTSLPIEGFSGKKENIRPIDEWKEIALQQCLSINYQAINAFNKKAARDVSFWTYQFAKQEKWTPAALTSLNTWVNDKTFDYHSTSIPVKAESIEKPVNAIFAKCMEFYRSSELSYFLKELLRKEGIN